MELEDYIIEVRGTLQDYPELNHILLERDNSEEYSVDEVKRNIKRSLARINMRPPVTTFPLENFPETHWLLIVDGAIIEALQSKGLLKIRNDMPYQDQGGTTVQLDGKGERYMQTSFNLYTRWKNDLDTFKNMLSVQSGYGGVHSEYLRNWW